MFRWLTRIRELDRAVSEATPPRDIARVQTVDFSAHLSSRERAPFALDIRNLPALAAGHHNGIYITGIDKAQSQALVLFKMLAVSTNVMVLIMDPSTLTLATDTALVPFNFEDDPDVVPVIHSFDIATANIPATAQPLANNGLNATGCWGLPMCAIFPSAGSVAVPQRAFCVFTTAAATALNYTVQWQTVRR